MKYSVFFHHIKCAAKERGISVEEMLREVAALGIAYTEVDRDEIGDTNEKILAFYKMLTDSGMKPSSIYGFYNFEKTDILPNNDDLIIRQASIMKCDRIMVIPGFYSDLSDPEKCKVEKERMIEGTKALVEYAKDYGITVTIECFDNEKSPISTIAGISEFLDAIPDLYVTLETGNFLFSGEDILKAEEIFCDRVCHVHLKDRYLPPNGEIPEGAPTKAVTGTLMYPCAVGEGHIPVKEVLSRLDRRGYNDILTIEHFNVSSYDRSIRDSIARLHQNNTSK